MDSNLNLVLQKALVNEGASSTNVDVADGVVVEKLVAFEVSFQSFLVAAVTKHLASEVGVAEFNFKLVLLVADWSFFD